MRLERQDAQLRDEGEAALRQQILGLAGKVARKKNGRILRYDGVARTLGADASLVKQAMDDMVSEGELEKIRGSGYVPTSKIQ